MTKISERIQTADWKSEKHVPAIDCPAEVKAGEPFEVSAALGKQQDHPNTTEHHIRWISLYFLADGDQFAYQVGHFEFCAHGESAKGPNEGPVFTDHSITARMTVHTSGTLIATSLCNIHGLWEGSRKVSAA